MVFFWCNASTALISFLWKNPLYIWGIFKKDIAVLILLDKISQSILFILPLYCDLSMYSNIYNCCMMVPILNWVKFCFSFYTFKLPSSLLVSTSYYFLSAFFFQSKLFTRFWEVLFHFTSISITMVISIKILFIFK